MNSMDRGVFDPDVCAAMVGAYQRAWKATGPVYVRGVSAADLQFSMASAILDIAGPEDVDPVRLGCLALARVMDAPEGADEPARSIASTAGSSRAL